MQRYYRVDLCDLLRDKMTFRRAGALIAGLPPESMFATRIAHLPQARRTSGHPQRAWSTEAHLLAALIDTTNLATWITAGGKKAGKQPSPIPRPGDNVRRRLTPAQRARIDRRNMGRSTGHGRT